MAIFRIEKTADYTTMSNRHFKDKRLSLKSKGLLSQMLSLPENWDYTLKGLAHINRESIDAIRTAIWELEKAGYVKRRQIRRSNGKMAEMEYVILKFRKTPMSRSRKYRCWKNRCWIFRHRFFQRNK